MEHTNTVTISLEEYERLKKISAIDNNPNYVLFKDHFRGYQIYAVANNELIEEIQKDLAELNHQKSNFTKQQIDAKRSFFKRLFF